MNDKITLQNISDLLAEKQGMLKKDTELFVKVMFDLIVEGLATENYVKIKGLGTFKLTEVESRESVNISTGERIEIQGHTKISFTPDTIMKELVNKPFSHFETVVLNEGVDLEDTAVETPIEEPDTEQEVPAITPEMPMEPTEIAADPLPEEPAPVPEVPVVQEEPAEVPESVDETAENEDEVIPVEEEPVLVPEETPAVTEVRPPVEEASMEAVVPEEKSERKLTRILMGIIVVLVLIILAGLYWLFLRSDETQSPKETAPIVQETVIPEPDTEEMEDTLPMRQDTLKQTAEPVSQPSVSQPQPLPTTKKVAALSDTLEYKIVGTRLSHVLQDGETLIKLSVKFYGSKNFWPYIVKHNKDVIQDYDRVPIGTTLRIPELEAKGKE